MTDVILMAFSNGRDKSNDAAVQGTNDSSIISKCSMAAQGYFEDNFLKLFVSSPKSRRAPLINRGYYIRARIIDDVLKTFLTECQGEEKQVISLGAGFDSAFFRLQASGHLDRTKFIEVDFPQVAERKRALIQANRELLKCLDDNRDEWSAAEEPSADVWLKSERYYLLGTDLCDLNRLQKSLKQCQVDTSIPTLLLSECVITYMKVKSSNSLIEWCLKTFPNSIFASYEQIQPDDAFGVVMQNHFKKLNSTIKAIQTYPSLEAQCQRYTSMGWPHCQAVNMNQYYLNALSPEERARIESLELFDEYEEWHLKCAHYIVAYASAGRCRDSLSKLFHFQDKPAENVKSHSEPSINGVVKFNKWCKNCSSPMKCYAHASARTSANNVLICGGFGETTQGKHSRLNSVMLLNLDSGKLNTAQPLQKSDMIDARLHHTINSISQSQFIIFGGRTSPAKPCASTIILTLENHQQNVYYKLSTLPSRGNEPTPRWRHSAVLDQCKERLIVYGGCTIDGGVLDDLWWMEVTSGIWHKANTSCDLPKPRHSHTMSHWKQNKFIIAGGIACDLRPLPCMYVLESDSWECSHLHLTPSLTSTSCRYSHTSHICGDNLMLVGGINPLTSTQPPVVIINLIEGTWRQYTIPAADPEHPIMLHNHSSVLISDDKILILGGGGNCFSFGTHLNRSPVELTLEQGLPC
ncbi:tRNA wybutosine-synthesizing protein 4-like [Amphiura filiformis]|uniref:tRNA wybutosine-synthesizing protein 4-like n=1 Tax=Amphiura filiformis TaxID=82378 RepID=UPI003B221D02